MQAFQAAGNGDQYPGEGLPFQPSKLYFGFIHHGFLKLMIKLMTLFGKNPHHFGCNKDIDLTRIISVEFPAHAVIKLKRQSISIRNIAANCHASQGGARPYPFGILKILDRVRGQRDYFRRAYPPPSRRREKDLFEGL